MITLMIMNETEYKELRKYRNELRDSIGGQDHTIYCGLLEQIKEIDVALTKY